MLNRKNITFAIGGIVVLVFIGTFFIFSRNKLNKTNLCYGEKISDCINQNIVVEGDYYSDQGGHRGKGFISYDFTNVQWGERVIDRLDLGPMHENENFSLQEISEEYNGQRIKIYGIPRLGKKINPGAQAMSDPEEPMSNRWPKHLEVLDIQIVES